MSSPGREPVISDLATFTPELRRGLDQLARASDYAFDLDCPLWEFAVEIEQLVAQGMTTSDLRWLIKRGVVEHSCETTSSHDQDRKFKAAEGNLAFSRTTCFVLTDAGLAMLGRAPAKDRTCALADFVPVSADRNGRSQNGTQEAALPNWDPHSRTFRVGEHLVKRFRVPSPNQEAVLDAFQEESWPTSIDDPLPPVPYHHPKRRLRDTIKCLNLNQAARLIRFRGDGTGERVLWELVLAPHLRIDTEETQARRRAA
jgi:hypothetical protein